MKILVLNGSPKKKSDTFRLTEAFLRGMNRLGTHEVHIVNAIDRKIAPCRGCFGCWQRLDGHCVIQDDQNDILDLYRGADASFFLCRELIQGYLDGITGVYGPPKGYFAAEQDPAAFEAFDALFPPREKQKLPGQLF